MSRLKVKEQRHRSTDDREVRVTKSKKRRAYVVLCGGQAALTGLDWAFSRSDSTVDDASAVASAVVSGIIIPRATHDALETLLRALEDERGKFRPACAGARTLRCRRCVGEWRCVCDTV